MRRTIIAVPAGPERPFSADSTDVLQHGVAPRWKVDGHPGIANGFYLHNDLEVPHDGVRVRLPRRLCTRTVPADDAMRWIRGQHPSNWDTWHWDQSLDALHRNMPLWERRYPARGLGLPKRLPRGRRSFYAPVLNIGADLSILLDDQHVVTARHIEAEFHREVIRENWVGYGAQTFRQGDITAKVTIDHATSAAVHDALRASPMPGTTGARTCARQARVARATRARSRATPASARNGTTAYPP